jgi:hypothetical protein
LLLRKGEEVLRPPTVLVGGCERGYRRKVVLNHLDRDVDSGGRAVGRYLMSIEAPEGSIIYDAKFLEEGREGIEGIRVGTRDSFALRQASCAGQLVVV